MPIKQEPDQRASFREDRRGLTPCELCVRLCLGLSLSELWWPHLEKQVVELTPESAVKMTIDDPENVLEK